MTRAATLLTLSAVTISMGLVALARPAAAAEDKVVPLLLSAFRDLVVDDAHGHVFVTGGGSNGIVIRNLEGEAVTTISDEPGASQMALSADGSRLYVALATGDAISAIDTSTLTEAVRYPTGAGSCPSTVAVTAGKVWFGYGCSRGQGNLGVIDPSANVPAAALAQLPPGTFSNAPGLQTSVAKPGLLVAGEFPEPEHLQLIDVSTATPTLGATRDPGNNLLDWALTVDGSHVITASGSPYYHPSFSTTDLSADGTYGFNNPYPDAVATGAGGIVAAGIDGYCSPDITIYRADGTSIRSYKTGGRCEQSQYDSIAHAGLAFSADTSHLYAVTRASLDGAIQLHVLHDVSKSPTDLILVMPSGLTTNKAFTVAGSLISRVAIPAGEEVIVRRDSAYGNVLLPSLTTSSTGSFFITDTVTQRGNYGYTITWAGDASHAGLSTRYVVAVTGMATTLTIATAVGPYSWGARSVVIAHLGTTRVRTVSLYATPYGSARALLKTGGVDARGDLKIAYAITRRTVFTAVFNGDDTYQPRSVAKALTSRAHLTTSLSGAYGTSGGYKLFHASVDPLEPVTVAPNQGGACMSFAAQRYSSGAWHPVATNGCLTLDSSSHTVAELHGGHPIGGVYRLQATFNGTTSNVRTVGPYLYLKFNG